MENNGNFCQIISIIQPGLSLQHNLLWDLSFAIFTWRENIKVQHTHTCSNS